ncbi:MAG: CHAT domain-containing protein [Acidobacteria bacterium]|nr:CHAT domain-containing protein [Acidobacteriota bacterium]
MRLFNLRKEETRFPEEGKAYADIHPDRIFAKPLEDRGSELGRKLFASESIRRGLYAATTTGDALRVRLYIDPAETNLHRLPWEVLCDADGSPLFQGSRITFSRYLNSRNPSRQPQVRGRAEARALVVIASYADAGKVELRGDPSLPGHFHRMAPVDVRGERKRAEEGFRGAGIAWNVLATGEPDSVGPATVAGMLDQLDRGYDILYIVCHGGLTEEGEAVLLLEEGEVFAEELLPRIRRSQGQPRLVILASCESMDGQNTVASGTLSALGPQLVDAGIAAVVAMQGKVLMSTVACFMPDFLAELSKGGGQIDRAMCVARERTASAGCHDYWMPVLFSRLITGQLWDGSDAAPPVEAAVPAPRVPVILHWEGGERQPMLDVLDRYRRDFPAFDWCVAVNAAQASTVLESAHQCLLSCLADTPIPEEWKTRPGVTVFQSDTDLASRFDAALRHWLFVHHQAPLFLTNAVAGIDHLPSDYAARIGNFLGEYLGTAGRPVPYGGRGADATSLQAWLEGEDRRPYALLAAVAGRGKSALVTRWCAGLTGRAGVSVVFVPVSIRFRTNLASVVFASLAARLATEFGEEVPSSADTTVDVWRGLVASYLRRSLPGGRRLLVVIDGLDEAADWNAEAGLFPKQPPEGLKVLVTARYRAGDTDGEGWLQTLGWEYGLGEAMELEPLSREGVSDVMLTMGAPLDKLGARVDIVGELHRLSEGDPLLVRLYVEDLWDRGQTANRLQPEDLREIRPGLSGYFQKWWKDQQQLWGNTSPLREAATQCLLNLLACALGPLRVDDLLQLAPDESGLNTWSLEESLRPLSRYVIGDGREQGFVFSHPKLSIHFYGLLSLRERREWDQRFLNWGASAVGEINAGSLPPEQVPPYLVQYYGAHLQRTPQPCEALLALVSDGWRRAWLAFEGAFNGFLNDVERAWRALESDDARRVQSGAQPLYLDRAVECALTFASVKSLASNIPPELLAALVEKKVWTGAQALAHLRQIPDPVQQMLGMASVASLLDEALLEQAIVLGPTVPPGLILRFAACGRVPRALELLRRDTLWIEESGNDELGNFRDPVAYEEARKRVAVGLALWLHSADATTVLGLFGNPAQVPLEVVEALGQRLDEAAREAIAVPILGAAITAAEVERIRSVSRWLRPERVWSVWESAGKPSHEDSRDLALLALAPALQAEQRAAVVEAVLARVLRLPLTKSRVPAAVLLLPLVDGARARQLASAVLQTNPAPDVVGQIAAHLDDEEIGKLVDAALKSAAIAPEFVALKLDGGDLQVIPKLTPRLTAEQCLAIVRNQLEAGDLFRNREVLAATVARLTSEDADALARDLGDETGLCTAIVTFAPAFRLEDIESLLAPGAQALMMAVERSRYPALCRECIGIICRAIAASPARDAIFAAVCENPGRLLAPVNLIPFLAPYLNAQQARRLLEACQRIGDSGTLEEARREIGNAQDRLRFGEAGRLIRAGNTAAALGAANEITGTHREAMCCDLAFLFVNDGDLENALAVGRDYHYKYRPVREWLLERYLAPRGDDGFDTVLELARRGVELPLHLLFFRWPDNRLEILRGFLAPANVHVAIASLPDVLLRQTTDHCLEAIGGMDAYDNRVACLIALAQRLEGSGRTDALRQLLALAEQRMSSGEDALAAMNGLERFDTSGVDGALEFLDPHLPGRIGVRLSRLPEQERERVWRAEWTRAIDNEVIGGEAGDVYLDWIASLAACAPQSEKAVASMRVLGLVMDHKWTWQAPWTHIILRIAPMLAEPARSDAWRSLLTLSYGVAGVLEQLPDDLLPAMLPTIGQHFRDRDSIVLIAKRLQDRPDLLATWRDRLPETVVLEKKDDTNEQRLERVRAIVKPWDRALAIARLAAHPELAQHAYDLARQIDIPGARAHALQAMFQSDAVGNDAKNEAIRLVLTADVPYDLRVRLLINTRDRANPEWRKAAAQVWNGLLPLNSRESLRKVSPLIAALPEPELYEVLTQALHLLSRSTRAEMVQWFDYMAECVELLGGPTALSRTSAALERVIACWP